MKTWAGASMTKKNDRNFLIMPIAFIALSLGNYLFGTRFDDPVQIASFSFWLMIFIAAASFIRIKMNSAITSLILLVMIFVSYYLCAGFLLINLYAVEMKTYMPAIFSFLSGIASAYLPIFINESSKMNESVIFKCEVKEKEQ